MSPSAPGSGWRLHPGPGTSATGSVNASSSVLGSRGQGFGAISCHERHLVAVLSELRCVYTPAWARLQVTQSYSNLSPEALPSPSPSPRTALGPTPPAHTALLSGLWPSSPCGATWLKMRLCILEGDRTGESECARCGERGPEGDADPEIKTCMLGIPGWLSGLADSPLSTEPHAEPDLMAPEHSLSQNQV